MFYAASFSAKFITRRKIESQGRGREHTHNKNENIYTHTTNT